MDLHLYIFFEIPISIYKLHEGAEKQMRSNIDDLWVAYILFQKGKDSQGPQGYVDIGYKIARVPLRTQHLFYSDAHRQGYWR